MEKINATGKQDNRVDIIKSKKNKKMIFSILIWELVKA